MNKNLLKAKSYENGMTYSEMLKAVGADKSTFYRQSLKNTVPISTVQSIIKLLSLTPEDVQNIFFEENVA